MGEYDLVYTTQLKQTGREERFAHWAEIIKTISQMRPDIVTSLLPIMLKDTDSSVVTDVQEVLKQSEEAQAQKAQQQEQIQLAQREAQIRELQAKAMKLEAQAQLSQQLAQAQAQAIQLQTQINPTPTENTESTQDDILKKTKKQLQISQSDMR